MMVTARMPRFIRPVVGVHGRKLSFKQTANGTVVIGGAHRAMLDMEQRENRYRFWRNEAKRRNGSGAFPGHETCNHCAVLGRHRGHDA